MCSKLDTQQNQPFGLPAPSSCHPKMQAEGGSNYAHQSSSGIRVNSKEKGRFRELLYEMASEEDRKKLTEIIREINDLLEVEEEHVVHVADSDDTSDTL